MTALRLPGLETPCSGKGSQAGNPHPFVLLQIYMLLGKEKRKLTASGKSVTCPRKLLT